MTIRYGAVPRCLRGAAYNRVCAQASATESLVAVPGTARFLARRGREIVVAPEPGFDGAHLRVHLDATVWPALLQQRGRLVLHASSVVVGGAAVLLAGRSGTGKSTLAAALHLRHDLDVLGDDVCVVDPGPDGRPVTYAGRPELALWRYACERLALQTTGAVVHPEIDKHHVELPRRHAVPAICPVRAVYLLTVDNEAPGPAIIPAAGAARQVAMQAVAVRSPRVVVLDRAVRIRLFTAHTALAGGAPLARLARRWDPWAVEDVAAALVEDLGR